MAGATERRHEAGPHEVSGEEKSALKKTKDSREKVRESRERKNWTRVEFDWSWI